MVEVHLVNKSGKNIAVTGKRGDDWSHVVNRVVAPNHSVKIGDLAKPGGGSNWGWIYLRSGDAAKPDLQAYVCVGAAQGVTDYAIQHYDKGENTDGTTIQGTTVKIKDGKVMLEVDYVFDPWMKRIPDATPLHHITIPGTHDSATHELLYPSKTQNRTIPEQLYMGVRHFDIRIDSNIEDLRVVHGSLQGSGNTSYYLVQVAEMLRDFLIGATHLPSTTETVILQLKIDRNADNLHGDVHARVLAILRTVFKDHLDRLYLAPIGDRGTPEIGRKNIPGIGDLRGKLVLLRRYEYDQQDDEDAGTSIKYFVWPHVAREWALDARHDPYFYKVFEQNQPFEWPDSKANPDGYCNRHLMTFVIQDDYGADATTKKALVRQFLDAAAAETGWARWYLNFASIKDPGRSAEQVNPDIRDYFVNGNHGRTSHGYGTILLDFAELKFVRPIIAANF